MPDLFGAFPEIHGLDSFNLIFETVFEGLFQPGINKKIKRTGIVKVLVVCPPPGVRPMRLEPFKALSAGMEIHHLFYEVFAFLLREDSLQDSEPIRLVLLYLFLSEAGH